MKKFKKLFSLTFLLLLGVSVFLATYILDKANPQQELVNPQKTEFTIVALPDTQYYAYEYPKIFKAQTQWIAENKGKLNIVFVTHQGDIVQTRNNQKEWQTADEAFSLLDETVPYGLSLGNHDSSKLFNQYFPASRFKNKSWYGGHYGQNNDNNYQLFSASGMGFIAIHMEYYPSDEVLAWADQLLKDNPHRRAIVSSHYILTYAGFRSRIGNRIYQALKDNPNLFLMLSAHMHTEDKRTDWIGERAIHQLLANYQARANGGNGFLRILRFVPEENKIYVKTYSPYLDEYEVDENSQFELEYQMTKK